MADEQTILIVEDNERWQAILKEALEDEGYDVTVIADYQYSRQALQKSNFDLVILDLELDASAPTLEGKRLLNLISRGHVGTPCIIVSGKGDVQTVRDAFKQYRVVDYIAKDRFEIPNFIQAVQDALMKSQNNVDEDGSGPTFGQAELRRILNERFDLEEIKDLCFDLNIDFDDLPGAGKKAREVVKYCRLHGRLAELDAKIAALRPESP
jgi:DNA-binding NtrC family response regulator